MSGSQPPWDWLSVQQHFSLAQDPKQPSGAKIVSNTPSEPATIEPNVATWHSSVPPPLPRRNSARMGPSRPAGYVGHYAEFRLGESSPPGFPEHYEIARSFFKPAENSSPKKGWMPTPTKSVAPSQTQSQSQPHMQTRDISQPEKDAAPEKGCACCVIL